MAQTECTHFIDHPVDPHGGTYCKLPGGHLGAHSAHYPERFGRCLGCRIAGPALCGGCGAFVDDGWDGR